MHSNQFCEAYLKLCNYLAALFASIHMFAYFGIKNICASFVELAPDLVLKLPGHMTQPGHNIPYFHHCQNIIMSDATFNDSKLGTILCRGRIQFPPAEGYHSPAAAAGLCTRRLARPHGRHQALLRLHDGREVNERDASSTAGDWVSRETAQSHVYM